MAKQRFLSPLPEGERVVERSEAGRGPLPMYVRHKPSPGFADCVRSATLSRKRERGKQAS
jgi:hypothetical protein